MTTEEKLQHFYQISIESAREESTKELTDYQETLLKMFEEHKDEKQRSADTRLKLESENARRETNKALSSEQLHIKRKLSKKQQELRENLFEDVKERLAAFRSTPSYLDWMEQKIKDAQALADGEEMQIYLTPEDEGLLEILKDRTKAALLPAETSFFGGIDAVIPGKNILIDHTFKTIFETEKEEYQFDGGLMHE